MYLDYNSNFSSNNIVSAPLSYRKAQPIIADANQLLAKTKANLHSEASASMREPQSQTMNICNVHSFCLSSTTPVYF